AIGFAIGVDRVVHALHDRKIEIRAAAQPLTVICGIDEGSIGARIRLASLIRASGYAARADVTPRKIGKQLEGASRDGAVAVIIVEPDGRYSLRAMIDGRQDEPTDEASVLRAVASLVKRA
ncbi:MAG: hypothetical protein ACKOJD_06750, partial [Candidatus Limnocylindrus sp.]